MSVLMVMIFKDYDKLATYENLLARPKDLCWYAIKKVTLGHLADCAAWIEAIEHMPAVFKDGMW